VAPEAEKEVVAEPRQCGWQISAGVLGSMLRLGAVDGGRGGGEKSGV
jgi:hypothetical protein